MAGKQGLFIKAIVMIVVLTALGAYLYINRETLLLPAGSSIGFVSKIKPISYDYNSQAGFYPTSRGNFYFYTRDGISYRDSAGEVLWNDPIDMLHPEAFGAGEFIAVAELRGTGMRVYGPDGLRYSVGFDLPILNFSVNESGYGCVKLQNGNAYKTRIYTDAGELLQDRNHTDLNVFPLAAALSKTGMRLALSMLDINGVNMQSHLMFANTPKDSGEWGGFIKDDQILTSLKFIGETEVLASSDLGMYHYTLSDDDTVREGAAIAFDNEVRAMAYMGDNGVALALGRGIAGEDSAEENTVRFYNAKLSLVGEFVPPKQVTYLSADRNGAIVGTGYTYYGLTAKGVRLWQYNSTRELKQLLYLDSMDTLLEVGFTEARILKRERITEPVEGTDVD